MRYIQNFILLTICLALAGCAANLSPDYYTEADVGGAQITKRGVIIQARQVTIGAHKKLGENSTGIAMGGIAGGVVGSQMGGGSGQPLAMLAGAGLGALGGSFAEKALSEQQGMEYTVEIDGTKELITVTQGKPAYAVGTAVKVIFPNYTNQAVNSREGRARIVPFNG